MQPSEYLNFYLELARRHVVALEQIAQAVARLVPESTLAAPNYCLPLESWHTFDWTTIGATVERTDSDGAAIVAWRGRQFIRRSPSNKFDPVVFFSRCTGKDERGENQYERLCTFKPLAAIVVEPLPPKVARLVHT